MLHFFFFFLMASLTLSIVSLFPNVLIEQTLQAARPVQTEILTIFRSGGSLELTMSVSQSRQPRLISKKSINSRYA